VLSLGFCAVASLRMAWSDLVAGWALAVLNSLTADHLNRRAVGAPGRRFLLLGVAGNLLRVVAMIATIGLWVWLSGGWAPCFLAAVLTGYVMFLMTEIRAIHSIARGGTATRRWESP
jgi:hypothetical protein